MWKYSVGPVANAKEGSMHLMLLVIGWGFRFTLLVGGECQNAYSWGITCLPGITLSLSLGNSLYR